MTSKLHHWFKSNFAGWGGLCLLVELHREGSAPVAGAVPPESELFKAFFSALIWTFPRGPYALLLILITKLKQDQGDLCRSPEVCL